MNRIWLAIGILGVTCAGCQSGSAPDSGLLPRSQVSSVAPVPKNLAAPVGKWTKSFDDGSHLDLEIEPTYIRFALQEKDAVGYWAFVGTCRPSAVGVLSGVITTIQWEGEEENKIMRFGGDFRYTLWYAEDGDRIRVMKIKGDCFDNGGEANCSGPYEKLAWRASGVKAERVEAPGVRPAHFETWTIGDEGVRMTFGKAAEREQFPGSPFAPLGPGSFGRD